MRIAILSDIHANLEALEAVLKDAALQGCTGHVCLGDMVGFGADDAACVDRVRDLACPVVKGDFDETASDGSSLDQMNPVAAEHYSRIREQLGAERQLWLRRLTFVREVEDFTIVHSSLDRPAGWYYVTNQFDAMSSFSYQSTQVCFHGHTHVPRVFVKTKKVEELPATTVAIEEGAKYFVNAGSVGQPRDGDWRACYVIHDLENRRIIFRRVDYDLGQAQAKIIDSGLPPMQAERLADGR